MHYNYLLFDLDHTLLDFAAGEDVALTQLLEELKVDDIQAYKDYYVPMNRAMWDDLDRQLITKQELIDTRFSKLFAHFGIEVDGKALAKRYQEFIAQQGQAYEGAVDLLEQLAKEGFKMYGATNGVTYIQRGRMAVSPITPYFEEIYISDEVGYHKPEAEFFEHIFEKHPEIVKEQAVMIGDNLLADIGGANNAGIDSVWYNPFHKEVTEDVTPTTQVATYDELYAFLHQ